MSAHKPCSICEGVNHHWLPFSDEDFTGYVCKHCPARTENDPDACECKNWPSFEPPVDGAMFHHSLCAHALGSVREESAYVEYIKPYVAGMTVGQLEMLRAYIDEVRALQGAVLIER